MISIIFRIFVQINSNPVLVTEFRFINYFTAAPAYVVLSA